MNLELLLFILVHVRFLTCRRSKWLLVISSLSTTFLDFFPGVRSTVPFLFQVLEQNYSPSKFPQQKFQQSDFKPHLAGRWRHACRRVLKS